MRKRGVIFGCLVLMCNISLAVFSPVERNDINSPSVEYGGVTAEQLLAYSKEDIKYNFVSNDIHSVSSSLNGLECDACKFMTGLVQYLFRLKRRHEFIIEVARFWCIKLKIEDARVCNGVIPEFQNEVLSVFDDVGLSPKEVCGYLLGPTCAQVRALLPDWNITLTNVPKPPVHPTPLPKVSDR